MSLSLKEKLDEVSNLSKKNIEHENRFNLHDDKFQEFSLGKGQTRNKIRNNHYVHLLIFYSTIV